MIFYFSGTGNSQAVAKEISIMQKEPLVAMAKEMKKEIINYVLKKNEPIIFVFPVYAWRPPKLVVDFIERIEFENQQNHVVTIVVTCGDNIGDTIKVMKKSLAAKGLEVSNAFSLKMPNNYLISGQVDSSDEINSKLEAARYKVEQINECLLNKQIGIVEVKKGVFSPILTYVIGNLFNKYGTRTDSFFANNNCISCKVCEKICSTNCIKVEGKPQWNNDCIQCLACLHYCPKSAIQYGNKMSEKMRYTHPLVSWFELNQSQKNE